MLFLYQCAAFELPDIKMLNIDKMLSLKKLVIIPLLTAERNARYV